MEIFIPEFIAAQNEKDYTLTTLRLIAMLNDTHADILNDNPVLESFKGAYRTPFRADFIENKLVVNSYSSDTLNIRNKVKIGDVIISINGETVDKLIKKYLPLTPASNYETQLRDMPFKYLLRSNNKEIQLVVSRNGKVINSKIPLISIKLRHNSSLKAKRKPYYLINERIGYLNAGDYHNSDLSEIKKMFSKTKNIVVDLREYPSDFMPYTFGGYIKSMKSLFVKFSMPNYSLPGSFVMADSAYNGSEKLDSTYDGNVIVLVNSDTQSQGEFTVMALQSSPNVRVIGSQTAGADGNVTTIVLPGGIYTMFSGMGIFYPDNSPTQRIGVKIDKIVKPTIRGTIDGKDELLEKAIQILNSGQ